MKELAGDVSFGGPSVLMDEINFERSAFLDDGEYKIFARGSVNEDNIFEVSHYEAYNQDIGRFEYVIGADSLNVFRKRAVVFDAIADSYFEDIVVARESFLTKATLSGVSGLAWTAFKEGWTNPEKVFGALLSMAPGGFAIKGTKPRFGWLRSSSARPQGIKTRLDGGTISNNINMRSADDLMGIEPASPELLAAVSKKRDVVIAQPGSEELRMLDYFGAEASVGGVNNTHILLREVSRADRSNNSG